MHKYLLTISLLCSNFLYSQSSPYQCAEIKSPAKRLACYDNMFTRPSKQINNKKPQIKQKDKTNEDTFGLSYSQPKKADAIPGEEQKIVSSIIKATKQLNKKVVFRLENGHIWQSESSLHISKIGQFKKGTKIELEVRMGAFWMINASNKNRIKVIRIE